MVEIQLIENLSFQRQAEEELYQRIALCRSRDEILRLVREFHEKIKFFVGHIILTEHPKDMPTQEYQRWWASLTDGEQRRYKEANRVAEAWNLLTVLGRTYLLTYIGSNAAVNAPFSQYFAVGTFPIANVAAGDLDVNGEIYRQIPSSSVVTGTQVDVQTIIPTASANGNWTNAGLYGINATVTAGSGVLMTHAILIYTKVNGIGVTVDYVINLT